MLKKASGVTLIELIVVITILTILLSLSTIAFNNYIVNYNTENEVKTLYADITGARMRAMIENRPYMVKFTSATSYVAAIDINGDEDYDAGDIRVDKYSKTHLKYNLVWAFPGNTDRLILDNRGLVNVNGNIRVNSTNDAEYDCIAISNTRIKLGKWNGKDCIAR